MNLHNACIEQRLALAIVGIKHLDAMGCVVTDVDVRGKQPVLHIERNNSRFLHGVMKIRTTANGVCRYTLVARVDGCLVQWTENHDVPLTRTAVTA